MYRRGQRPTGRYPIHRRQYLIQYPADTRWRGYLSSLAIYELERAGNTVTLADGHYIINATDAWRQGRKCATCRHSAICSRRYSLHGEPIRAGDSVTQSQEVAP